MPIARAVRTAWIRSTAARTDKQMRKAKIKVGRIEAARGHRADSQVCITFQIDCGTVSFQVPIHQPQRLRRY